MRLQKMIKKSNLGTLIIKGPDHNYKFPNIIINKKHYLKCASVISYMFMDYDLFYAGLTIPRQDSIKTLKYDNVPSYVQDHIFWTGKPVNIVSSEALYYDILGFLKSKTSQTDINSVRAKNMLNALNHCYHSEINIQNNIILELLSISKPSDRENKLLQKLQDLQDNNWHESHVIQGMQKRHSNDIDKYNDLKRRFNDLYEDHQKLFNQYENDMDIDNKINNK